MKQANKFTFKKQPKATGLGAVGYTKQSIYIKLEGKICGSIDAPNWTTKDNLYSIRLMVFKDQPDSNPNCNWKWITFKFKSGNPEECKQFLNDNFLEINAKYKIRVDDY